jgi:hypothetical protein
MRHNYASGSRRHNGKNTLRSNLKIRTGIRINDHRAGAVHGLRNPGTNPRRNDYFFARFKPQSTNGQFDSRPPSPDRDGVAKTQHNPDLLGEAPGFLAPDNSAA